jgi:hypothetical protein
MWFVVQPFLFRHARIVVVLPSVSKRKQEQCSKQRALYIAGFCERLAFFRIPRVASAVHEFTFIGSTSDSLGFFMAEAVFHLLPLFTGLHTLTCEKTFLTNTCFDAMTKTRTLSSLILSECILSVGSTISQLPLKHLDLKKDINCHEFQWTIRLPERLQHLQMIPIGMSLPSLAIHGLRVLRICTNPCFVTVLDYVRFLEQFPSLEVLSIFADSIFVHIPVNPPPLHLLPSLVSFHGPPQYIQTFCRGKSLKHVSFWRDCDASAVLPSRLQELYDLCPQLQSLSVRVPCLTQSILNSFALFALRELTIYTGSGGSIWTEQVYTML